MNRRRPSVLVWVALSLAPLLGCGSGGADLDAASDGHDHHGHDHDHDHAHRPGSLHEAVAELTAMRDAIRDALLDGEPNDAHGPLHEVGALLQAIPDVAAETDLPKEEWDAVNAANEELFDAFGTIDKAFHVKDGDKKAAYEEVSEQLEEAIEAIRVRLPLTGESPDTHDHDHDHDHDDHDHDHEDGDEDESSVESTEETQA